MPLDVSHLHTAERQVLRDALRYHEMALSKVANSDAGVSVRRTAKADLYVVRTLLDPLGSR